MQNIQFKKRRKPVVILTETEMVKFRFFDEDKKLPIVIEPSLKGVDIHTWLINSKEKFNELLTKHGAVLLRGFQINNPDDFRKVVGNISGQLLEYKERSSPRTEISKNVYTSTDYPQDQEIFLHNENSYQQNFPLKIFFYCQKNAELGGETPIADCRRILDRIDEEIRLKFKEKGWMYVRNFGEGFGLNWQTVFQTSNREKVEEHCLEKGISFEWKENNCFRTYSVRPAISKHPITGENVWFNHATFFHVTTLDKEVQQALKKDYSETNLPTNTFYGDGEVISNEVVEHLRQAYRKESVSFPWKEGDILCLDNMLVAHGRNSFQGERKILVGMGQAMSWEQI